MATVVGTSIAIAPPTVSLVVLVAVGTTVSFGLILGVYGVRGIASTGLYLAAALVPLNGVRVSTGVAASDVALLLSAGALLLILPNRIGKVLRPVTGVLAGGVLVFGGSLVGAFFSNDQMLSLLGSVRFAIVALVLPLIMVIWKPSLAEISLITKVWSASIAGNSVLALWGLNTNSHTHRASALTLHPNHLAMTAVIGFGTSLGLFLAARTLLSRLLWATVALLCITGISVSGSRAGLIGIAVVSVCVALFLRSRAMLVLSVLIVAAFWGGYSSGLLVFSEGSAFERMLESSDSAAQSDEGRRELLAEGMEVVSNHFLTGSGFSGTVDYHSLPVQLLAASGVVGVLGFLWLLADVLASAWKNSSFDFRTSAETRVAVVLMTGWVSGHLGFLASDLFQNAMWERFAWFSIPMICLLSSYIIRTIASARGGT